MKSRFWPAVFTAALLALALVLLVGWGAQISAQEEPVVTPSSEIEKIPPGEGAGAEEMINEGEVPPPEEFVQEPPPPPEIGQDKQAPPPSSQAGEVTLYFKDVDIRVLIQFMAKLTGKHYVVSDKVGGKVSIVSPKPVSVDEAVRIFESVLQVHDFTTITEGDVVKVISIREARREGTPLIAASQGPPPGTEAMVTQLISLQYADANTLRGLLIPLAGRYAYITADPQTNSLVITDSASNVRRLVEIITSLDKPGAQNVIAVIPLTHASAADLAQALSKLFQTTGLVQPGKAQPRPVLQMESLKALADERTNSLILLGPRQMIEEAKGLVASLDTPETEGKYNIHVIHLKYAVAEDLAKALGQLAKGGQAQTVAAAGQPAPSAPATGAVKLPVAEKEAEKIKYLSERVSIVAEPATNSLIIAATPQEFKAIESIIAKLDIPRTMVYVEAVILEMSASKALEFGVRWQAAGEVSGGIISGGIGQPPSGEPATDFGPGFNFGLLGPTIQFGDLTIPSLAVLIRAVQSDADIRVLATPQILTADNEEATIEVAQNLPFVTRVDQGTSETDRTIQVFDYRDVGYTLKVTPRISDNEMVRLSLEAEAKAVISTQTTDAAGNVLLAPTTNVRQAKTVILTRNGDIVAIGGLIGQELEKTGEQVPCLGSLPMAGWAFKSTKDTGKRTNLLIFLSPHILATPEQVEAFSKEKRDYGRQKMPKPEKDILSPYRPQLEVPPIFKPEEPQPRQ